MLMGRETSYNRIEYNKMKYNGAKSRKYRRFGAILREFDL
jgi:hypothetical protein